jgi:hypothetical protein
MKVEDLIAGNLALTSTTILANTKPLLTPVYNPLGYGALGDGLADDTAYVQAAINDAQVNGGVVALPGGYTFLCNSGLLVTGSNVTFTGGGTLYYGTNPTFFYLLLITGTDIVVDGINFDGSYPTGVSLVCWGTRVKITRCTFKTTANIGVYLHTAENVIIANNIFIGPGSSIPQSGGIQIDDSTQYVDIIGNTFYGIGDDCVGITQYTVDSGPSKHINIVGNLMYNGYSRGVSISSAVQDVLVTGNYFNTIAYGGVEVFLHEVSTYTQDIMISGNYFINCGTVTFYSLLADYDTNLTIKDNTFQSCRYGIQVNNFIGLKILNNTFNNITIGRPITLQGTMAFTNATDLMIVGNTIDTCPAEGVYLVPASGQTINKVVIANNVLSNTDTGNGTAYSIVAYNVAGLGLVNNVASFQAYSTATVYYDVGTCTDVYSANNHP